MLGTKGKFTANAAQVQKIFTTVTKPPANQTTPKRNNVRNSTKTGDEGP